MFRRTTKKVLKSASSSRYLLLNAVILLPAIVVAQETNPDIGARLTSGRLASLAILFIGMVSVVIGYKSKKRFANPALANNNSKGPVLALILGLLCVILSVIHLADATDFGTGGGKAGSIVAVLAGSIGVFLASVTLYRMRNNKVN